MDVFEDKNGIIPGFDGDNQYVNIHFLIGDRKEIACFRPDKVTDSEIKELFRSAAEAGPLDIVKLRKGDKILNISQHLPENKADDPYVLQVVCAHSVSSGIIETDLFHALERRVMTLEQELYDHKKAISTAPCIALRELKMQVDLFKKKLETTEHLSWLGFHKQLPEPISSEACRRLQYRRKSDSIKKKVREKFLNICDIAVSASVREWLRSPAFDARQWEDEELLLMLQTMFVELELPQKFNIHLSTLRNFIYEVYNNYNDVPFHNFRHCFCVAQMMYAMTWAVDLITKIGHLEVFILIVSCICHDLDHPGYNNIYQINARTELALRYNDISPLENHHCSVAFHILEAPECNILASFDFSTYRTVREGIIRCILATDMARHNEILAQFTEAVSNFDYSSKIHINLLSMVLIKVADISNEARPMDVAEPWLDSLLQEFFKQSDAEKLEGLPVTPFMDRDKVTKPSSQCSFIGLVLLPLFEILGEHLPELQELIVEPVRYALAYYKRLNEAAKDARHQRKSIIDLGDHIHSDLSHSHSNVHHQIQQNLQQRRSNSDFISSSSEVSSESCYVVKSVSSCSTRSRRSMTTLQSRSRSIEDDVVVTNDKTTIAELADLESSDPETATEVEISEKTLKFKISTEENCSTSTPGRKSYPNSRKGSHEKSSLVYYNQDLAKAVREHEREKRCSRGENLSSDMSSPISARSYDVESRILEELECDDQHYLEFVITKDERRLEENDNTTQQQRNNWINKRTASMDRNERKTKTTIPNDIIKDAVQCCCDDRLSPNNHKSFLSRLRNLTDRLSISFDSKETPAGKSGKSIAAKVLNKSITINSSSKCDEISSDQPFDSSSIISTCKKCNLSKLHKNKEQRKPAVVDHLPSNSDEAHSMTLPKVRRTQDNKNKSWRTVFVKEKRPSMSLETLPVELKSSSITNHRRNLSNPEGKNYPVVSKNQSLQSKQDPMHNINFKEIDIRPTMPEIFVDPIKAGSSSAIEDTDQVEIRRSSASMEDISKIAKESEIGLLGCSLDQQEAGEGQQHTGSLDSMLNKDTSCGKNPVAFYATKCSSQSQSKKPLPSLFSRFKSGMSIDTSCSGNQSISNSGPIHEQQAAGWISSITSSFRSRRQGELAVQTQIHISQQQQKRQQTSMRSPSREELQ